MAQFDRQIATALKLIKKYGQPIDWVHNIESTDPATPWLPSVGSSVSYEPIICFLPINTLTPREIHAYLGYVPGIEAQTGMYYGLMGSVEFNPSLKDTVSRDGVKLNLATIDLLAPNGQKVLYTMIFNG